MEIQDKEVNLEPQALMADQEIEENQAVQVRQVSLEDLAHQVLLDKEVSQEQEVNQAQMVSQVVLELQAKQVKLGSQALLDHLVLRVQQDHREPEEIEGNLGQLAPQDNLERGDHEDLLDLQDQVDLQDLLGSPVLQGHKDQEENRDLKDPEVNVGHKENKAQLVSLAEMGNQVQQGL